MKWNRITHSAHLTDNFLFNQLIPYIGNKRKLLDLIQLSLKKTGNNPVKGVFIDCFAGSGVVSRLAKTMGYKVLCNDWEPYSKAINVATIQALTPPTYFKNQSYKETINYLNQLPPLKDWITTHLCPEDDLHYNPEKDRLFYMRKNGLRIDAIREKILQWEKAGELNPVQLNCLLAPLLYSACYHANTSGIFKGFHKGWGGQTGTALYRIQADLMMHPIQFFNNYHENQIFCMDAQLLAEQLQHMKLPEYSIAYLDPPYNQHPYGSNYHVLNSITLWDKPITSSKITPREKAAIRKDWREDRKSAYTFRKKANQAYHKLLQTLPTQWIATSYSTDGFISLEEIIRENCQIGQVSIFARSYKRYRVSSQRYSHKSHNIEFIILTKVKEKTGQSVNELVKKIHLLEDNKLSPIFTKNNEDIYCFS